MTLDNLISGIEVLEIVGDKNVVLDDIMTDSDIKVINSIYFCYQGVNVDGHNFFDQAVQNGAKVLLIDADTGLNNLDVLTGTEQKITFDVSDVIEGRCRARQAIVPCGFGGLFLQTGNQLPQSGRLRREPYGTFKNFRE
jgi:hypothetical protein